MSETGTPNAAGAWMDHGQIADTGEAMTTREETQAREL